MPLPTTILSTFDKSAGKTEHSTCFIFARKHLTEYRCTYLTFRITGT